MKPGLGLLQGFFALKCSRTVIEDYLIDQLSTVHAMEVRVNLAPLPEFIPEHEPTTSGTFHCVISFRFKRFRHHNSKLTGSTVCFFIPFLCLAQLYNAKIAPAKTCFKENTSFCRICSLRVLKTEDLQNVSKHPSRLMSAPSIFP